MKKKSAKRKESDTMASVFVHVILGVRIISVASGTRTKIVCYGSTLPMNMMVVTM